MSEERFDTRNFERYAMSVLMEFYCREWDCFRYGQGVESPDLQCEKPEYWHRSDPGYRQGKRHSGRNYF